MISSLSGILKTKNPTEVLLDVNGVGYAVSIPLSTYEQLGDVGVTTTLLTYLQVREDLLQLYGFATEEERYLFKLLISVSGIGPKIAQGILSGISVRELKEHISRGNVNALTTAPGVGRKTAERLVVELRDKITRLETISGTVPPASSEQETRRREALLALTSLGYNRLVAEKALRQALNEANGQNLTIEELIKRALQLTATT